jgi:hypothetical protein
MAIAYSLELAIDRPPARRGRGLCSGIRAGTERLVLSRLVPEAARALMELPRMRGGFALPIAYGDATVGQLATRSAPAPRPTSTAPASSSGIRISTGSSLPPRPSARSRRVCRPRASPSRQTSRPLST